MLLYSQWRSLSLPTRIQLAQTLGIKKFGPTHVRDNVVESDGYLIEDVEKAITVEALQELLDTTETDITKLFNELVWRAENPDEFRKTVEEFKEEFGTLPVTKKQNAKKTSTKGKK